MAVAFSSANHNVAKKTLAFDGVGKVWPSIENTEAKIRKVIQEASKQAVGARIHVCCEATGIYCRALQPACEALEEPFSQLNPADVRHCAEEINPKADSPPDEGERVIRE